MRSSRGVTRADLRSKLDHRVRMQANRHSRPLDGAYGFVLLDGSRVADDLRRRLWRRPLASRSRPRTGAWARSSSAVSLMRGTGLAR
jgi:hypothetical protein